TMRSADAVASGQAPIMRERRAPAARPRAGCSQRRLPALRACPAVRRRALAPTARRPRRTSRPVTPLLRAPARGGYGRPQPGTRRVTRRPELVAGPLRVAWHLACTWTYSAPFVATVQHSPSSARGEDGWRRSEWGPYY